MGRRTTAWKGDQTGGSRRRKHRQYQLGTTQSISPALQQRTPLSLSPSPLTVEERVSEVAVVCEVVHEVAAALLLAVACEANQTRMAQLVQDDDLRLPVEGKGGDTVGGGGGGKREGGRNRARRRRWRKRRRRRRIQPVSYTTGKVGTRR